VGGWPGVQHSSNDDYKKKAAHAIGNVGGFVFKATGLSS